MLEHTPDILAALCQANVSLRWLLLHSFSRHRKLKAAVKSVLPAESEQLKLVLQIAQLEYQVVPPQQDSFNDSKDARRSKIGLSSQHW